MLINAAAKREQDLLPASPVIVYKPVELCKMIEEESTDELTHLQVAREGTKKTVFTNFMELNKSMNRQPEHVQQFLLAELGTSGSLDGQSRLIVKGRFQPKAFEGVLRRYMNE